MLFVAAESRGGETLLSFFPLKADGDAISFEWFSDRRPDDFGAVSGTVGRRRRIHAG
jgi:hypothetical protein